MMGKTDLHELRQSIRKESRAREKAAASADAGPKLTAQQLKVVRRAVDGNGIVEWGRTRGLASSSWERMMVRLCGLGLFRGYVHGGYEITDAGRAADGRPQAGRPVAD
jgi:hypothetical protein